MPARNASAWIDECIQSIVDQSLTEWELLVLDDHSTDETAAKLLRWRAKDDRIRIFEPNGRGILPALCQLDDEAKGEWITRMDADDVMPLHKLESLFGVLGESKSRVATGKVKYFSIDAITEGYQKYEQWLNDRATLSDHYDWIYRECVVAGANWLCHRSLVNFKVLSYPEDYDLTFQWYQNEIKIAASEKVTHLWREHPERTSRNDENYQQLAFFKLKLQRFVELDLNPKRPLLLIGDQRKSAITQAELSGNNVSFTVIHKNSTETLRNSFNPQVLVTVFPSEQQRQEIRELLLSMSLVEGKDWWWL